MLLPSIPARVRFATILLASTSFALFSGLVIGSTAAPAADPCALPGNFDLATVSPHARDVALGHVLACNDYEHDRTTLAAYRARIAELMKAPVVPHEPAMVWATSVRAMSSQYAADSWAATRALGAPDVFPASGDNAKAWASRDADAAGEFLELGFPMTDAIGVDIFETFNPGAITSVELVTADGAHHAVYQGTASAMGSQANRRHIELPRIDHVVGVRVTLDSTAVPGWNEIDAVGLEAAR